MPRTLTYFVSDVHLGLRVGDSAAREAAFVRFLAGIDPEKTSALYLLGDIWDFWYEYRDVVPRGYVDVLAALRKLVAGGVEVYFFRGNHDIWTFGYFEELGLRVLEQPYEFTAGGRRFCVGHGDGLGPGMRGYKLLRGMFRNRLLQRLFSGLHPWLAFRLGEGWSRRSRLGKNLRYQFQGPTEPLYKFCEQYPAPVDYFIFGHYHSEADVTVKGCGSLLLLGDWITRPNWLLWDTASNELHRF